ncbi:unnamed protein product [Arctogadus glacialis]
MLSQKLATNYGTSLVPTFWFHSPQNGGEERNMDFHSEGSHTTTEGALPLMATFKSGDERKPRPTELGRGRLGNKSQDDQEGDGSLPCTPELQSEVDTDSQAGEEVLDSDTKRVICTFLRDYAGASRTRQDEVQVTMTRVVDGVLEKHQYAYKGMIQKLELDGRGEDMSFVTSVAKSLFADSTTNWGRIASLVAFGAALCRYLEARGKEGCVSLVAEEISSYLLSDQREWLVKNNSWEGFVEFFRVSDPETTVRNTLMAFAGFAGIGATIALLIRSEGQVTREKNRNLPQQM